MKRIFTLFFAFILACNISFAQTAPDFTFTDINGVSHTLSDALNEGKVILLDFFFVDCPPCNTWGPEIDQIAGDFENTTLEVWAISDRDSDAYIAGSIFNPTHNNHFVGGSEGSGNDIVNLYANNFTFLGFPTYSVICSDGSIVWDIWPLTPGANEIRSQLTESCGVVDLVTSVPEIQGLNGAVAYPNPASDLVTIEMDLAERASIQMDLYNALGQRVLSVPAVDYAAGQQRFNMHVSDLNSGLYQLRLQSEEGAYSMQLIIE